MENLAPSAVAAYFDRVYQSAASSQDSAVAALKKQSSSNGFAQQFMTCVDLLLPEVSSA